MGRRRTSQWEIRVRLADEAAAAWEARRRALLDIMDARDLTEAEAAELLDIEHRLAARERQDSR